MIIVFGSINIDSTYGVKRLPQSGETVLAESYSRTYGGKGANQAVAASRHGSKVVLIGCVGTETYGKNALDFTRREGVITSGVSRSESLETGTANIAYDKNGKKHMIVHQGANLEAKQDQIPDEILTEGNIVLMQMEVTPEENWVLIDRAKQHGITTILNLAPASDVPQDSFKNLDYLIINEIEAKQVAESLKIENSDSIQKFASAIAKEGDLTCIVTLGKLGSIAVTPEGLLIVTPTLQIEDIVDTTGAGDCFCGTLAAALHDNKSLEDGLRIASVAAALSCRSEGTQSAYARLGEIEDHLEKLAPSHIEQL